MSENLKSCPFCGGVAVIGADSDCDDPDYRVCCTECTTGVPDEWHTLRSNAISAWNQRTPMPDEKWTMPIWMRRVCDMVPHDFDVDYMIARYNESEDNSTRDLVGYLKSLRAAGLLLTPDE